MRRRNKQRRAIIATGVETLERRELLTTTPIWNDPVIVQTNIDEVIYTEGADISGDGVDDALAAGPNVLYYKSNRDGTFAEVQELTDDGVGYGMTLARDVDGDNDLDVIASSRAKGIVVIKNNGDGSFEAEDLITSFEGITRLSTADMDGDGDLDLVSGSYSEKRLAWHENLGDGSFDPEVVINGDAAGLYSVATADLNDDGQPEIVTAEFGEDSSGESNAVALYFQTEEGFDRTIISNDLNAPLAVEIADIDGDGDQDVVAGAYSGNEIIWYENDGSAGFTTNENSQVTDDAGNPFRIRAADWDNDADLDLISTSSGDDKVAFHENLGGGEFAEQVVLFDNWSSPTAGSPADVDGDGDQDLLVASYSDDTLLWVKNDTVRPDERFGEQLVISDEISAVFIVDAVDLDGDGSRDLIGGSIGDQQVVWAANDGSGEFRDVQVIDTQDGSILFAGAADLDGDGDNDVFTTSSFGADEISWYENLGDGNFGEQQVIAGELTEPRWLDAADADGDGDLDLFGSTHDDSRYFWYENRLNEETSDFVLAQVIDDGEGEGANKIFAIDMDDDGDLDAFTASATPTGPRPFAWYENDGTGNFTNPTMIAESTVSKWYARPADMDGDGDIDVVASSFIAPLVWFENLGDGTFSSDQVISTGPAGSYGLDVADLDGDGDYDVVTGSYADNEVAWYENNGDGTFSGQQVLSRVQSGLFSVVAADIDGDGDEDILAGSYYDNTAAWYENSPVDDGTRQTLPNIDKYATTEHLDLSFNFQSGQWMPTVDVDELDGTTEFYTPDEIVIFGVPAAASTRPEGELWDFTGAEAGDDLWVLPENRNEEVVYPGFAVDRTDNGTFARYFENDPRIDAERDWVRIQLVDVRGPDGGEFGTYSSRDRDGDLDVIPWMSTADGIAPDDSFWQREGGHSHVSFFFTQPGVYEVDLKSSGFIDVNDNRIFDPGLDVFSESEAATFYFAIDTPNSAPTIIVPDSLEVDAGESLELSGDLAVQISDAEPSGGDYHVDLQSIGGTLSVVSESGETVSDELTLTGPLSQINAELSTLKFNADPAYSGEASIQIDVNDLGFFYPDLDTDGVSDNAAESSATTLIAVNGRLLGDLDGDGDVDAADRTLITQNWTGALMPGSGDKSFEDGDLDQDGDVDSADVTLFAQNWTGAMMQASIAQEAVSSDDEPDADSLTIEDIDSFFASELSDRKRAQAFFIA